MEHRRCAGRSRRRLCAGRRWDLPRAAPAIGKLPPLAGRCTAGETHIPPDLHTVLRGVRLSCCARPRSLELGLASFPATVPAMPVHAHFGDLAAVGSQKMAPRASTHSPVLRRWKTSLNSAENQGPAA